MQMKWLKDNGRDLWTLFLCLLVVLVTVALIGVNGYCIINYGSKPITEVPSICFMVRK